MKKDEFVEDENRKVRLLRMLVDLNLQIIANGTVSRDEALERIEKLRAFCLKMFPDKGNTFDIIYRPRFLRLLDEIFGKQDFP